MRRKLVVAGLVLVAGFVCASFAHAQAPTGLCSGTVVPTAGDTGIYAVRKVGIAGACLALHPIVKPPIPVPPDTTHPPIPGGTWPNEPKLPVLSEYGWTDPVPMTTNDKPIGSSGWNATNNTAQSVADPTSPTTATNSLKFTYPLGMKSGTAPGTIWHPLSSLRTLYAGFWWKVASPWQGDASNVNKIAFWNTGNANFYLAMYGSPGGPYVLRISTPDWLPNANVPVVIGSWHLVETVMDVSAGKVQVWIDNVQVINTSFNFAGSLTQFELSPTWGGIGDTKKETDFYYFNRVRLSGK